MYRRASRRLGWPKTLAAPEITAARAAKFVPEPIWWLYPKLLTFPTPPHHIQSNKFNPPRGIELRLVGI